MKKFATALVVLDRGRCLCRDRGTTSARATDGHDGIVITFQKHMVDPSGIFQGPSGGAVKGELESRLVPGTLTIVATLDVRFDCDRDSRRAAKSFTAHASGTMIGAVAGSPVVMDGVVTSGWHQGAAWHMQGQLVDPATFTITGTLTIQPGNSGS